MHLEHEIRQQRPFPSQRQAAVVGLLRTADTVGRFVDAVIERYGITGQQYNVLRILRGAGEGGLACGAIADRMITRDPDITRLLDRLEARALIARHRSAADRRVVMARVTPAGLELLAGLDAPILALHRGQLGHLGRERLRALTELLQAARAEAR